MKRIYVTHCSREKDSTLEQSGEKVTPDRLYTSPGLQRFIRHCNERGYDWAILSDHYGVVFKDESIAWYNKPPDSVTEEEFKELLRSFVTRLKPYDEIYFHHRASETHPVFSRIVNQAKEQGLPVVEYSLDDRN